MFDKQVDQLFENWDHKGTPGVAVAVVKDGKCLYKKGYGIANLEYDIPITPSTPFNAGSISKMFTAFSILLLTEEGKLSLEDDVRKYIPEVPDFGKIIRIKHLVYHTSGLREQEDLLAMAGWHFSDVRRTDHILKLISKQRGVNFNPGEKYQYCNTGYTLLAEIVKRIVDQPFSKFTEERIFAPLNMNHTLFYDNHEGIVKNRAYSYFLDERGVEYCNWPLNNSDVGARGLFTTVEDLSQWVLNFENPVVGNPEIIMQMNEPGCLNNGRRVPYAFGQEIGAHQGLNWLGHSGVDASFRAHLGRFIDQSLSVIVLSNNATFVPDVTANKVTDLY